MALFATHNESNFRVGDLVRVHIQDQMARRRESVFEGYVLGIRGEGENKSFLVRRIGAANIGIERIFPLQSPLVTKIEVRQKLGTGTRRAKLYFLRDKTKSSYDLMGHRSMRKGKAQTSAKITTVKASGKTKKTTPKKS